MSEELLNEKAGEEDLNAQEESPQPEETVQSQDAKEESEDSQALESAPEVELVQYKFSTAENGEVCAELVSNPEIKGYGPTEDDAVRALQKNFQ